MQEKIQTKSNQSLITKAEQDQALTAWKQSTKYLASLIKQIENKDIISFNVSVREKLLINNTPNYPIIIDDGMPLWKMKKEFGLINTVTVVSLLLSKFCSSFNVSKNMTAEQIADYSVILVENNQSGSYENPSFRLEDLIVFFEKAKTGVYGRPFDYIDASLIESWLDKYWKARSDKYYNYITIEKWNNDNTETKLLAESKITDEEQKKSFDKCIETIKKGMQENEDDIIKDAENIEKRRLERLERTRKSLFEKYENSEEQYQKYLKSKKEDAKRKLQKVQKSENEQNETAKDK